MKIPEFWRFDGEVLRIDQLQNQQYLEVEASPTFPAFPKEWLYEFLDQCRQDELMAEDVLRDRPCFDIIRQLCPALSCRLQSKTMPHS